MEEGGLKGKGEDHISHLLSVDSPFMKPEFVLDAPNIPTAHNASSTIDPSVRAELLELQRRLIQRNKETLASRRQAAAAAQRPPKSASPFRNSPSFIKLEESLPEGYLDGLTEEDISYLLTVDSPFMKPEFVMDAHNIPTAHNASGTDPSVRAELPESQRRVIQQDKETLVSQMPAANAMQRPPYCSRPASPFHKPPKVIKHEGDDSLYVKVEDLPEDVREQVRAMAAEGGSLGPNGDSANNNNSDHTNPSHKPPLISEPTRLSAQPTMEEIQMCFAQVDLAILMETKPATRRSAGPTLRSAAATTAPVTGSGRLATMAARRREKWAAGVRSKESMPMPPQQHQAHSDSESDSSSFSPNFGPTQNPKPITLNASLANAQPPSRMQQLLVDLANSRRISAAAAAAIINGSETDKEASAVKRSGGRPELETTPQSRSWPPFAVSSNRSRRNSEQIQQNFSFLQDDFVSKLDQIQGLATAAPSNVEEADVRASSGSRRAYQVPVWTHGGSASSAGGGSGRVRYQCSWSGRSQEEYELMDPLVASRRAGNQGLMDSRAGDGETSTDTESPAD